MRAWRRLKRRAWLLLFNAKQPWYRLRKKGITVGSAICYLWEQDGIITEKHNGYTVMRSAAMGEEELREAIERAVQILERQKVERYKHEQGGNHREPNA